jgi:peptidoglycan L-alanyl-D-glutamate endopeptidase CwlK
MALAIIGTVLFFNRKRLTKLSSDIMEYTQAKVWDMVSEEKIAKSHPMVREKVREFLNKAEKQGIKLRITSSLRTYAEQDELYAQGRTKAGSIVTNAKGGQSNHNFGTAIDVVPIVNGQLDWNSKDWAKIGEIGKSVGFAWGGDWKGLVDKPHFEMQFGNTLAQLKQKYESGQRDGDYVKLT